MSHGLLYTIGHSNHSLERFADLLRRHDISAVADVRSSPYSRFCPHFNREELKAALSAFEVVYVFLGKELGARPASRDYYVHGRVSYTRLAASPEFHDGLDRIRQGIERYRLALLCAEKDPIDCHRMILVCRHLRAPSLGIRHIAADGSAETNESAEERLCKLLHLKADLFTSEAEVIETAYERQGEQIAYTQYQEAPIVSEA